MHKIMLNNDMGQTYGVSCFPKTTFLKIIISTLCLQKERETLCKPKNYTGQTHNFSTNKK